MKLKASEIAAHLNSKLEGIDIEITSVSIDSREVGEGQLFVPMVAERDGHEYISSALERGASLYLTQNENEGGNSIKVKDTAVALESIGALARNKIAGKVVGITGSVGKTTTKDLIKAACTTHFKTHANVGSFNNEMGVPITIIEAPDDTEVLVSEMGARGIGHISHLCEYVKPDVAVITRVALAHSEMFGSIEGVKQAKGELVESLSGDGIAILNADDPNVATMAELTECKVVTYGETADDYKFSNIIIEDDLSPRFDLEVGGETYSIKLSFKGEHMVANAAAAIATAVELGVPIEKAIAGVEKLAPSKWRMEVETNANELLIINDSYNANPVSMRAALKTLAETKQENKVAVIGIMGELGEEEKEEHLAIANEAKELGFRVISVNCELYGTNVEHVANKEEAYEIVKDFGSDHALLVKASNSVALFEMAEKLLK